MNRPSLGHVQYLLGQLKRVSCGFCQTRYGLFTFLKIINGVVAAGFGNLYTGVWLITAAF